MADIRMIVVDYNTGDVTIDASQPHLPLTDFEEAIQLFVVTMFTTIGTLVDDPSFGGSGKSLIGKNRDRSIEETRRKVGIVVHNTILALSRTQRSDSEYVITESSLIDVEKTSRGIKMRVNIIFRDAPPAQIGVSNVTI